MHVRSRRVVPRVDLDQTKEEERFCLYSEGDIINSNLGGYREKRVRLKERSSLRGGGVIAHLPEERMVRTTDGHSTACYDR
jgi:hypothetical protein